MSSAGHDLIGSSDYNPYTGRYTTALREAQLAERELAECRQQLDWHAQFDLAAEVEASAASARELAKIQSTITALRSERQTLSTEVGRLDEQARPGFDPRRWFSAQRSAQVLQRDAAKDRLRRLDQDIESQVAGATRVRQVHEPRLEQIKKFRGMNPLEIQAKCRALEVQLEQVRPELANTLAQKQRIDELLKAPMLEREQLRSRLFSLERQLSLAQSLERRLAAATNGRERAMVHQECGNAFGGQTGPGRVIQQRQRDIDSARRNLEKVEARLRQLSQAATRPMSKLVLDGNNLCYEGQSFIGLAPLLALTRALADRYEVIVVFDASIRMLLRMNDQQVRYDFPREVYVHIVATKQKADETVLELASAEDAYVISNDRFRDFTDKSAVSAERLIRHEIVAGKVLVHALSLSIDFDRSSRHEDIEHAG